MHIRTLETFYARAWMPAEVIDYDGWKLHFAEGYTRRANSVNPFYGSLLDLDDKLAYCEDAFALRGLPVVYKLTDTVYPEDLDAELAVRGYSKGTTVSVQTADLQWQSSRIDDKARYTEMFDEAWLEDFCRLNVVDSRHLPPMRRLLQRIPLKKCFMHIKDERETVAVGLGVTDSTHLALFDIVTSPHHRQRGWGWTLVKSLLAWGKSHGATTGTLQVLPDNMSALRLYARFGFTESYRYWYRT